MVLSRVLTINDHRRDSAGLTYVYPVVSRRAGGVSIGINLNPNQACNWRCIYCQVENLQRGRAPKIDVARLESELRIFLQGVQQGSLASWVPEELRQVKDIAFSGDGEPTTAREFAQIVERVLAVRDEIGYPEKLVLITNGSQMTKPTVEQGLVALAAAGGEVWFKLDRATATGMAAVNDVQRTPQQVMRDLRRSAQHCPTWIQSCWFKLDGALPAEEEVRAFVDFVLTALQTVPLKGVLLYSLARPSQQVEAPRLAPVSAKWLSDLSLQLQLGGVAVRISD